MEAHVQERVEIDNQVAQNIMPYLTKPLPPDNSAVKKCPCNRYSEKESGKKA